jgi:hypothetical protein
MMVQDEVAGLIEAVVVVKLPRKQERAENEKVYFYTYGDLCSHTDKG